MMVVIDYGMGNLKSISKAFNRLGIETIISSEVEEITRATKLILPGVGHFARGMKNLTDRGLTEILTRKVVQEKTPILGICLGMQLFCNSSEEGPAEGLGWLNAETVRFNVANEIKYKVPHVGWNSLRREHDDPVLGGVQEGGHFYFVHSYHVRCHDEENVLSYTHYEYEFVSAVRKENIFGTQFHPEKSQARGLQILKNFAENA